MPWWHRKKLKIQILQICFRAGYVHGDYGRYKIIGGVIMKITNGISVIFLLVISFDALALEQQYVSHVQELIQAIKSDDREEVYNKLIIPLKREKPIPAVKDKSDFLSRYDQIFDQYFIDKIINSNIHRDWHSVGWRGIMFDNGKLWISEDGRILSINYASEAEKKLRKSLINESRHSLHPSISKFKEPILEWDTRQFHIRIDRMNNDTFRYTAWPIGTTTDKLPDLVLQNGKVVFEGSGGNHYYEFTNDGYRYVCNVVVLGNAESPPGLLVVFYGDQEILSQDVVKVYE